MIPALVLALTVADMKGSYRVSIPQAQTAVTVRLGPLGTDADGCEVRHGLVVRRDISALAASCDAGHVFLILRPDASCVAVAIDQASRSLRRLQGTAYVFPTCDFTTAPLGALSARLTRVGRGLEVSPW